jgi:hypothetical protein
MLATTKRLLMHTYVTRESTCWIWHPYNRNSSTGKLQSRVQEERHEQAIKQRCPRKSSSELNDTLSVSKYLSPLTFFQQLWPLVLFKKLCKHNLFCLLYDLLLYVFKLDLSFYMFVITFLIRRMVKVARKSQQRQIFWYGGSNMQ